MTRRGGVRLPRPRRVVAASGFRIRAMDLIVDADGSLRLPPELGRALGLAPGATVSAEAAAGRIVVGAAGAAPAGTEAVKQQARDLAHSMRGIAAPAQTG